MADVIVTQFFTERRVYIYGHIFWIIGSHDPGTVDSDDFSYLLMYFIIKHEVIYIKASEINAKSWEREWNNHDLEP